MVDHLRSRWNRRLKHQNLAHWKANESKWLSARLDKGLDTTLADTRKDIAGKEKMRG